MSAVVLAGDVGGTKTHLGLYRVSGNETSVVRDGVFPTSSFASLEDACAHFLHGTEGAEVACFGVPGAVIEGRSHATNVPWLMDERSLRAALKVRAVRLINDLEATALGMLSLTAADTAVLQAGEPHPGSATMAVIAAGTGLGEGLLLRDGDSWRALASEGGHCDFGPRGDLQVELLRFIEREFGHASYERVLSGPGLFNIYNFLKQRGGPAQPQWLADRLAAEDPGAVIGAVGLEGGDPRCAQALEVFVEIYGAEAANLVLKALALGGVFVAGGIAPKIAPLLMKGGFIRAFRAKGRFDELLSKISVRVCLNPSAALMGATRTATRMLQGAADASKSSRGEV